MKRDSSKREGHSIQMRYNLIFLIIAILCLLSVKVKGESFTRMEVNKQVTLSDFTAATGHEIRDENNRKVEIKDLVPGKKYFMRSKIGTFPIDLSRDPSIDKGYFEKYDMTYTCEGSEGPQKLKFKTIEEVEASDPSFKKLKKDPKLTTENHFYVLEVPKKNNLKLFIDLYYYENRELETGSDKDSIEFKFFVKFDETMVSTLGISPKPSVEVPLDIDGNQVPYVVTQNYDVPIKSFTFGSQVIDFDKACIDYEESRNCTVPIAEGMGLKGTIYFEKHFIEPMHKPVTKVRISSTPDLKPEDTEVKNGTKRLKLDSDFRKNYMSNGKMKFEIKASNDLGVEDTTELVFNDSKIRWVVDGRPGDGECNGRKFRKYRDGDDFYWLADSMGDVANALAGFRAIATDDGHLTNTYVEAYYYIDLMVNRRLLPQMKQSGVFILRNSPQLNGKKYSDLIGMLADNGFVDKGYIFVETTDAYGRHLAEVEVWTDSSGQKSMKKTGVRIYGSFDKNNTFGLAKNGHVYSQEFIKRNREIYNGYFNE